VPNLIADRAGLVARGSLDLNVRRLMYQSLIWLANLRDEARRLRSAGNAEDVQSLPDPLIHGVRRDSELDRDFLRREVLADEAQAIELAFGQLRHAHCHVRFDIRMVAPKRGIRHPSLSFQFK